MNNPLSKLSFHIPDIFKHTPTPPGPKSASHPASELPASTSKSPLKFIKQRPQWFKNLPLRKVAGKKASEAAPATSANFLAHEDSGYHSDGHHSPLQKARPNPAIGEPEVVAEPESISRRTTQSGRNAPAVVSSDGLPPEEHSAIREDFFSRMQQCAAKGRKELYLSIEKMASSEIEGYDLNWMALGYSERAANDIKATASKELYSILHATELTDKEKANLFNVLTAEFDDWISKQQKDLCEELKIKFSDIKRLASVRKAMFAELEPVAKDAEREMHDAIKSQVVVVPGELPNAPASHAARANRKIAPAYENVKCGLVMQRQLQISHKKNLMEDLKTWQAKTAESLRQTAIEKFNEHQWSHDPSAPMWEAGSPPLLIRRNETWNLQPANLQLGEGGMGSVSLWRSETNEFAAKMEKESVKPMLQGFDSLKTEYQAFKEVYEKVGPHRNLVNAYGIANMEVNGINHRMLIMDRIPGLSGESFISRLRLSFETGKIKSEEYVGALQFIFSRIADVLEHVNKAGLAHVDVKLENFIVRDDGEPVLIDMGLAQKHGSTAEVGTPGLTSTDFLRGGFTEKSDVFSLAASVVDAMDGGRKYCLHPDSGNITEISPITGAATGRFLVDNDRGGSREAVLNQTDTAYSQFVNKQLLARHPESGKPITSPLETRDNMAGAMQHPFFADRLLADEEREKKAIRKVFAVIEQESGKPLEEQWKYVSQRNAARLPEDENDPEHQAEMSRLLNAFWAKPSPEGIIQLRAVSKTSPWRMQYIDSILRDPRIVQEVRDQVQGLIDQLLPEDVSIWFDNLAQSVRQTVESIGKKNIDGSTPTREEIIKLNEHAMWDEMYIVHRVTVQYLNSYVRNASLLLDGYGAIPSVKDNPDNAQVISLLRKNVAIAKDILHRIERSKQIEAVMHPKSVKEKIEELENQGRRRR